MLWIKFRDTPIPEKLYYGRCAALKTKNDETALHLWIQHRPGEDIPVKLYFADYQNSEACNGVPIVYWIQHRPNEPIPLDMQQSIEKRYKATKR